VKGKAEVILYSSNELLNNKLFLIDCYKSNKLILDMEIKFIELFDNLEHEKYDDNFIEEYANLLHLVSNIDNLCKYLLINNVNIINKNIHLYNYIKKIE